MRSRSSAAVKARLCCRHACTLSQGLNQSKQGPTAVTSPQPGVGVTAMWENMNVSARPPKRTGAPAFCSSSVGLNDTCPTRPGHAAHAHGRNSQARRAHTQAWPRGGTRQVAVVVALPRHGGGKKGELRDHASCQHSGHFCTPFFLASPFFRCWLDDDLFPARKISAVAKHNNPKRCVHQIFRDPNRY